MAEGGEAASEGDTVARVTPATNVVGMGTGPWSARAEVTHNVQV